MPTMSTAGTTTQREITTSDRIRHEPETLEETHKRLEREAARWNQAVVEPKDGIYCNLCGNKETIARVIPAMRKRSDGSDYVWTWYVQDEFCACVQKRNAAAKRRASGMEDAIENTGQFIAQEDWQRVMIQKAKGFLEQDKATCFFVGGHSGTGKTHLSTIICQKLIEQGHALLYRKWTEIMRELLNYRNENRGELFKELAEIDTLYIDDLFKPTGGSFDPKEIRATFEIIDQRYMAPKKITILSSELTWSKINRLDEATARRIEEQAGGKNGFIINIGEDKVFTRVDWRHQDNGRQ